MTDRARRTIEIKIRGDRPSPPLIAHGAFGGITPAGDMVIMNLYVDTWGWPDVRLRIGEDGAITERTTGTPVIERSIIARVLLTPEVAAAIAGWLRETARRAGQPKRAAPNAAPDESGRGDT